MDRGMLTITSIVLMWAALMLLMGAHGKHLAERCARCIPTCDAEVVSVRRVVCSDDPDSFYPTFRHTVGGVEYVSEAWFSTANESKYIPGDLYRLHYDPSDPSFLCRKQDTLQPGGPRLVSVIGAVILVMGLVMLAVMMLG